MREYLQEDLLYLLKSDNEEKFLRVIYHVSAEKLSEDDFLLLQVAVRHNRIKSVLTLLSKAPPQGTNEHHHEIVLFMVSIAAMYASECLRILTAWVLKHTNWDVFDYLFASHPESMTHIYKFIDKSRWAEYNKRAVDYNILEFVVEELEAKRLPYDAVVHSSNKAALLNKYSDIGNICIMQNAMKTFNWLNQSFAGSFSDLYAESYTQWMRSLIQTALTHRSDVSRQVLHNSSQQRIVEACLPELNTPEGFAYWLPYLSKQGENIFTVVMRNIEPARINVPTLIQFPWACVAYLTVHQSIEHKNPELYATIFKHTPKDFREYKQILPTITGLAHEGTQ